MPLLQRTRRKTLQTVAQYAVPAFLLLFAISPWTRTYFLRFLAPVYGAVAHVGKSVGDWFAQKRTVADMTKTLAEQREALARAVVMQARLVEAEKENQALRDIVAYQKETAQPLLAARVIAFNPQAGRKSFVIDRGTDDGVEVDAGVLSPSGFLVGVIASADAHSAVVRLLADPQARIAAQVPDIAQAQGVVMAVEGGAVALRLVPENVALEKGDLVLTSRLNPHVPEGLPLGVIESVVKEADTPFQRALIDTLLNPTSLSFVQVLKSL